MESANESDRFLCVGITDDDDCYIGADDDDDLLLFRQLRSYISNQVLHYSPILSNPNRSRVLRQAATTGSAPLFHGTGENLLAITGLASLKLRLNRPVDVDDSGGGSCYDI
jgi:hypothetical protein